MSGKLILRSGRPEMAAARRAPEAEARGAAGEEVVGEGLPGPALAGVRFKALSAPGPSGARPEHLRDMLQCGRRRVTNRLLRALPATQAFAKAGSLPPAWKWVLRTRLIFLRKKQGPKPRPLRVGELWRRVIAKHLLAAEAAACCPPPDKCSSSVTEAVWKASKNTCVWTTAPVGRRR